MPASNSVPPLNLPATDADAYVHLLEESRGLRRPQQLQRDAWIATLSADRRELLFELETLLKATACFANPRNHTGKPRRVPVVAQDFRLPLAMFSSGLKRVVQLARLCLGPADKAFVFHRYLETLLPEDTHRSRLAQRAASKQTPEASLLALRQGITNVAEVSEGLLRSGRISYRLFHATASLARREVSLNPLFNPLATLEFRPEFDRIPSSQVTGIIARIQCQHTQRLAALAFLSLFRMLRYLKLLEQCTLPLPDPEHLNTGRVFLILSVLRSDARALGNYLRRHGGKQLAAGFEQTLIQTSAQNLNAQYEQLLSYGHRLIDTRAAFECVSSSVRLELRRAFEHDMPSPQYESASDNLRENVLTFVTGLRPALQHTILFLAKSLDASLQESAMFNDATVKQQLSERLRQHVWMFAQIVRAFTLKAQQARSLGEAWDTATSLQFVREFLSYFGSMGYPLLRASDYPRFEAFLSVMNDLRDADMLDSEVLERALIECQAFYSFLLELVGHIGKRQELRGVAFDERSAARMLRLYLRE